MKHTEVQFANYEQRNIVWVQNPFILLNILMCSSLAYLRKNVNSNISMIFSLTLSKLSQPSSVLLWTQPISWKSLSDTSFNFRVSSGSLEMTNCTKTSVQHSASQVLHSLPSFSMQTHQFSDHQVPANLGWMTHRSP